ncbi:MAG: VOC family protein, partial [Vicinamibacterales bacterium]
MLHGRFVWHELMTTDIKGAASFFTKIIGWKTEPWANDPTYTLFTNGGQAAAGLMLLPEDAKAMGVPPNWCTHIGTPNVQQTVKRAESLGTRVHRPPTELPSVGTFAVLADPQGAAFAVYSPERGNTSDAPAGVGEFSWHELATTDYKAALEFYQALFGWENAGAQDMGSDVGVYQMFGRNGRPLGGIFTKPAHMAGPAYWLPYNRVKDARQVAAAAQKARGSILNGPMEVPGGY